MTTKTGENRPHSYAYISHPDARMIVDFEATRETAQVTVELLRDDESGELYIEVKCGPNARIIVDESHDITHEFDPIDLSESSNEDFSRMLENLEPDANQDDYQHHYEHGQWWVIATVSGETWSVVATEDEGGTPGIGFELVSDGIEE